MPKVGAGGGEPLGGGEPDVQDQSVEVNEEVIWKARAQEAEEEVEQLRNRIVELESELSGANETITQVERRAEIDRELTAAKAVDLETARLLTETVIGEMDKPDVALAVRELCDRKPYLFLGKQRGVQAGASMPANTLSTPEDDLGEMANQARSSGNRNELLRYLRARRVI